MRAPSFQLRHTLRIAAAAMFALAAPLLHAQALDSAVTTPRLDPDTRVLPVWSNASGRIEALLLLDPPESLASSSAVERVLRNVAPDTGIGTRIRLDNGGQVRAALEVEGDAGLALLCDGRTGIAAALGSLGEHCLLATLGQGDPLLSGLGQGARVGLGWQSPEESVDLSFGLSWLRYTPDQALGLAEFDRGSMAQALLQGQFPDDNVAAWARQLESRNLRIDSLINLGSQTRMLIGGDIGRTEISGRDGLPLQWDQASLRFGVGVGNFSGQLTGRLIELPRSGAQWSTLDIGLSWRTPWHGEFSLGARNVLGNADTSRWPLAELPAIEDVDARVPYVRYQQDL